jgi:tRNA-2-methylthio-N6-dimethylallyladenosine synthase
MTLIDKIRTIPDGSISQDMITGFPTETEEDHQDTLSLMEYVKYNFGYMYSYSERPGTLAGRKMEDDVYRRNQSTKITGNCRLATKTRLVALEQFIGQIVEVLVEKISKKSTEEFSGRNSQSITVVFQRKL